MSPAPKPLGPQPALPAHAPLPGWYDESAGRAQFVRRIFDESAADYDRIERLLAFGSGPWYRRKALQRAGLGEGERVLDVGIGTGLLAREALAIVGPGGRVTGIDPSPGMMAEVHLPGVELLTGRAEALPVADASADMLTMGYALRHVDDVHAAFREYHRALRPGGRLLLLEITRPRGRVATAVLRTYMRCVVPMLAGAVATRRGSAALWRYYWDTIEACIPPEDVLAALRDTGFTKVERHVELGIFSEYTAVRAD